MEESIKRILDGIEKVAPDAWANAVRFTQLSAFIGLGADIVFIVLSSFGLRVAIRAKFDSYDEPTMAAFIGGTICAVVLFIAAVAFCSDLATAISPEGALIMHLFSAAKSK